MTAPSGAFNGTKSDLVLNGLDFAGAVKSIKVRDILAPEPVFGDSVVETGGASNDKLSLAARNVGDGVTIRTTRALSSLKAGAIGDASITAALLGKLQTTAGGLEADLTVSGAVGAISVIGGAGSGLWQAASFGAIAVNGGTLGAKIDSAGAIAKSLYRAAISRGSPGRGRARDRQHQRGRNRQRRQRLRRHGRRGKNRGAHRERKPERIDPSGRRGSRQRCHFRRHRRGSGRIHARFDRLGKGRWQCDRQRDRRELLDADAVLRDSDDTILGGATREITSLTIGGTASADSLIAAGRFKDAPKVSGATIAPASDNRFFMS